MPLTIAIDGPVGAGKSSVADAVAQRLGILHLDTGAMYRAVGLAALDAKIDPKNQEAVCALCAQGGAQVDVRYHNGAQATLVNGQDVSDRIRTQEAGMAASCVSRYLPVRQMLVRRQRELSQCQPMLLDGRDIGTVVLPDATVKIYLTASAEARAKRRWLELHEKGDPITLEQVLEDVQQRDYNDTHRDVAPLRQAEDAVLVDTTECDLEESYQLLLKTIRERI